MIDINQKAESAIREYQCPGCVNGPFPSCFAKDTSGGIGCGDHVPGTLVSGVGKILLGMPKGFNRTGPVKEVTPNIFENFGQGWGYDKFNIPAWKYLSKNGHTFVRGISPRTNFPFIHIYLENCLDKIDCLEITEQERQAMD